MNPDAYTFDFIKIFVGEFPPILYVEIIFRVTVLYIFTLLMMRFAGRREVGQFSLVEFLLVLALGSAVGDPMFYADIPLLHGALVITLIILMQRFIDKAKSQNKKFASFIDGDTIKVIDNGKILEENLEHSGLNKEDLFMELRLKEVKFLEEVEYAYAETSGKVSVYKSEKSENKTSILP